MKSCLYPLNQMERVWRFIRSSDYFETLFHTGRREQLYDLGCRFFYKDGTFSLSSDDNKSHISGGSTLCFHNGQKGFRI